MREAARLALVLLVGVALLASGCGATSSTSTRTTVSTGATASANASSSTAGTSPTKTPRTSKAHASKPVARPTQAVKRKPSHPQKVAKATPKPAPVRSQPKAAKPSTEAALRAVPQSLQYPQELQHKFIASCTAGKASTSTCICLVVKFETSKVEKSESLAELLATEDLQRAGRALPSRIQRQVEECKRAGT